MGLRMMRLVGINLDNGGDKTHKVTTDRPVIRETRDSHTITENPADPLCTVKIYDHWVAMAFPKGWKSYLFVRKCPEKHLEPRQKAWMSAGNKGLCPQADYELNKKTGKPLGVWGRDYPGKQYKQLAVRVKADYADDTTPRSFRRMMVSAVNKSGTTTGEIQRASRHKDIATNVGYQEGDVETRALKHAAFQYDASGNPLSKVNYYLYWLIVAIRSLYCF